MSDPYCGRVNPPDREDPAPDRGAADAADDEQADLPGPDWLVRWRRRVAGDSRYRQLVWRIAATTLGAGIVLVGVTLLALPGPGWAIIFLGLAVLATEYAWAHRLLRFTKEKATGAYSSATRPENRKRTLWILLICGLLLAAAVSLYVDHYGWTFDGVLGWVGLT